MRKLPNLLSEVAFGAFLTYSPRGQSETSKKSRVITYGIKQDTLPTLARVVERLETELTEPVAKSAWAAPGERPDVKRHLETMLVEETLFAPFAVTIVDDVVTKGATLMAAASQVTAAFPNAMVRTFGLVRTMGLQPDIGAILDPCVGRLVWNGSDVDREP